MLTPTHLITAQTAYLAACVAAAHPPAAPEAMVALVAALIPDLDSRQSYPGRVLPLLSEWLERRLGTGASLTPCSPKPWPASPPGGSCPRVSSSPYSPAGSPTPWRT